ncbi:MAG TPA: nuclear transport factor 2 family protein [Acidimicrobiia bacterium]|nr:nuclear transport factor 2 family protein [Acidimicrobiia bacterium]
MDATPEVLVHRAEDAYNALDVDRVLDLFTSDAVFHMNGKLVAKGTDELRRWHERLFAAVSEYRLTKTLRAASGDVITVEFTETYRSAKDGTPMQGFGGEFWTMEGDRLAEWHLYWRGYPAD